MGATERHRLRKISHERPNRPEKALDAFGMAAWDFVPGELQQIGEPKIVGTKAPRVVPLGPIHATQP